MTMGLSTSLHCGCLTSSWQKDPWSRICMGRKQVGSKNLCPPPPQGCCASPPHPSTSPTSPYPPPCPPSSHPPSPPPSGGLEGLQALPPLPQGPVGQAVGCLLTGLASSSRLVLLHDSPLGLGIAGCNYLPPGSKIMTGLKWFASNMIVTLLTGITRL